MDEQNKTPSAARRFRLPRLFADNAEESEDQVEDEAEESAPAPAARGRGAAKAAPASDMDEMAQLRTGLETIYRLVTEINQREAAQEKVFNTLHSELRDYKNDFIYEHLKPVVRPLLFLFDSLEQFHEELSAQIRPAGEERRSGVSPVLVKENISYFKDQLVEALRICEVTLMEEPEGVYNPKLHKAVEVEPAPPELDNVIIKVVRSGWYLNGQLFRPAEVVIGKKQA